MVPSLSFHFNLLHRLPLACFVYGCTVLIYHVLVRMSYASST